MIQQSRQNVAQYIGRLSEKMIYHLSTIYRRLSSNAFNTSPPASKHSFILSTSRLHLYKILSELDDN